ncbi:unnamed protein product [Sphenostylis stenocarpa]|uniref:Uncharacterized protein n=1 Tax=Sphenostylis stenocarpa TaxID=92480 RepID=A0AA86THT0_9FABA|nr:unnamed protein product [Sphenostylis stenocarpa]
MGGCVSGPKKDGVEVTVETPATPKNAEAETLVAPQEKNQQEEVSVEEEKMKEGEKEEEKVEQPKEAEKTLLSL